MNNKAQELSGSWTMEWFIKNIVLMILFTVIIAAGLYFMLRWLTG